MKLCTLLAVTSSVEGFNIFADELANYEARFGQSNLSTFRSRRQRQLNRPHHDKVPLYDSTTMLSIPIRPDLPKVIYPTF